MSTPTQSLPSPEAAAEIAAVVAALEAAQNARDADAFLALFDEDAAWVTAFGRRLAGLAEIAAFTRQVLTPALGDAYARYEIVGLKLLAENVAAVHVRQRPVHADGSPIADQPEGRPLYVMVRRDGKWRLAVGQNTQVQAAAIERQDAALPFRAAYPPEYR